MIEKEKTALRELFHEIENAANAIKGIGELLRKESKEQERKKMVEVIISEAENIIKNIKGFTSSTFPSVLHLTSIKIDEIIGNALFLSKKEIEENNIALNYKLEEKVPLIEGDKESLEGAFYNLILNAVQAMPHGGVLAISTKSISFPHSAFLRVTFSDTGIGIKAENLPQTFHPFFTTKSDHLGLGLGIVKKTIEAHKGRIGIKRKKKGTVFNVFLPLAKKKKQKI